VKKALAGLEGGTAVAGPAEHVGHDVDVGAPCIKADLAEAADRHVHEVIGGPPPGVVEVARGRSGPARRVDGEVAAPVRLDGRDVEDDGSHP